MKPEEARCLTLYTFLHYMDDDEVFQVCFEGDEWENYTELKSGSILLRPFIDCRITCMGAETMDNGKGPAIRICLDEKGMHYDET